MEELRQLLSLHHCFPYCGENGDRSRASGYHHGSKLSDRQFYASFGLNLFVANSVTGVPISKIASAAMVFVAVSVAALMVITYVPVCPCSCPI